MAYRPPYNSQVHFSIYTTEKRPIYLKNGVPTEFDSTEYDGFVELLGTQELPNSMLVSDESTVTTVKVAVVNTLPDPPDPNTLYLVI